MFVLTTFIYVNGDTNADKIIKIVIPLLLGKKKKNCDSALETAFFFVGHFFYL